jgi:hypothetical protein
MIVRIALGIGLLALGYYLGRGVGRSESLRRDLDAAEGQAAEVTEPAAPEGGSEQDKNPAEPSA